jgi:hypothetical protein
MVFPRFRLIHLMRRLGQRKRGAMKPPFRCLSSHGARRLSGVSGGSQGWNAAPISAACGGAATPRDRRCGWRGGGRVLCAPGPGEWPLPMAHS